jgi:glutaminyl-peptide cyclotransferase
MRLSFVHPPALFLIISFFILSCGKGKKAHQEQPLSQVGIPSFNADSAYVMVSRQVAFGPRIPNTKAHRDAGDFIIRTLRAYGAKTVVQEFQASTFDGQKLSLRNIIGSFNPEKQKRVILAAHWDTRPYSDKDPVSTRKPFDGANDGGSGVGVLLEVARHLRTAPEVGVDLIFFDGEDWGEPDNGATLPTPEGLDSWWCLGSQYWTKHKHTPGYRAHFGILIDMVGNRDARFFQEGTSVFYAPDIVEKVWSTASRRGYGSVFIRQKESPITDDHLFVNQLADIPMIAITPFEPGVGYFGAFHHTQQDNLALISRETLGIVGDVLMQVIYLEE